MTVMHSRSCDYEIVGAEHRAQLFELRPVLVQFDQFRDDCSAPVAALERSPPSADKRQRGLMHGHAFAALKRGYTFGCGCRGVKYPG